MGRARIGDITLAYEDTGSGEPVVCIHGALIAETFRPLLSERGLAARHRLVTYHRRGYGGSGRADAPGGMARQADDCRRLLARLGIRGAHVAGHSLGGAIALQLAMDAPGAVHTLTLLEAAVTAGASAPLYRSGLADAVRRHREAGADVAVDEFLRARWPAWREGLDRVLPRAVEQAVADAATCFEVDLPAVLDWRFGEAEARRIAQPVLVVLGEGSADLHPRFAEVHRLLLAWLPDAEGVVIPGATHFLQADAPEALADALAGFCARHPIPG